MDALPRLDSRTLVATLKADATPLALADEWCALHARSDASFFLSWHWIGTGLESHPDIKRHVFRLTHPEHGTVALALLVRKIIRPRGMMPRRVWYLHECGDEKRDQTVIEYNGLLCLSGMEGVAWHQFFQLMQRLRDDETRGWDQMCLGGLEERNADMVRILWPRHRFYSDRLSWSATLHTGVDPVEQFSKNTRRQIRQSQRFFGQRGELQLEHPTSDEERKAYFDGMAAMHQQNFPGPDSGFNNPHFRRFHEKLALAPEHHDVTALLRCKAGAHVLGYLYLFHWQDHVLFYTGGLQYEEDNKARPGFVIHALAMQQAALEGKTLYDFMAGDYRYKRSLCQRRTRIQTLILDQERLMLRAERGLRYLKQTLS